MRRPFFFFEAYEETILTQKFKSISLGILMFIITYFITNMQCGMIYQLTNQITHI